MKKNKVIANYSDLSLTIKYSKFDVEKLTKKIYNIVKSTHKISKLTIEKTLMMLSIDGLYTEISRKLKKVKEDRNIELLLKSIIC